MSINNENIQNKGVLIATKVQITKEIILTTDVLSSKTDSFDIQPV